MADYDPDLLQTERPTDTPIVKVRPRRAGPRADNNSSNKDDDYDPSISKPMREILDHIKGPESGGRYNVIYGGQTFDPEKGHPRIAVPIKSGPNAGKTSSAAGAYQFLGSTWDMVSAKTGRKDMSKTSQDINAAELARDTYKEQTGRDLEKDWASGNPALKAGINRALGSQWESLAAGPRVGKLGRADSDYSGPGFGFSDYAMKEHQGRPGTDIHWMAPEDYLDLALPLEKPFTTPSGRSLMQSFKRGEPIESIPTLDVHYDGEKATVTDQDGRHRALLAQQEGLKEIPVAVRRTGDGEPKEITGLAGNKRPLDLPPRQARQADPEEQKTPIGVLRDAIMPRAEAAEVPAWAQDDAHQAQQQVPAWAQEEPPAGGGNETAKPQQGLLGKVGGAVADAALDATVPGLGLVAPHAGSALINPNNAAAAARGLAPYAAGAGVGAGIGAMAGGVGAIPGAIAGAGAVGLDQLATGLMGMKGPQDATNALLDQLGVRPSATPEQRVVEQMASGAGNAFTGAAAAKLLATTMKTPASKVAANWLMNKGGSVNDTVRQVAGSLAENPAMQTTAGAFSGGAAQLAAEAGLSKPLQMLVGFAAGLLPGGKGLSGNWRRINASPEAKKAIEAGFAIPPAEAETGHIGSMNPTNVLAAEGGKIKTQQLASAQNQIVVNRKVATDLGLPPDTPMFPEAYKQVRAREGQVYREVENAVPEVTLANDPIFKETVLEIGKPSESTERLFPSTKEPPGIKELRAELLNNARAPTGDVMRYIADLRSRATAGFQAHGEGAAMAHRMAFAEREAANALEDAMERSVQNAPQYYREKLVAAQKARDDQYRERARQGLPLQGEMIERADAEVQNWSDKLARTNAKNQGNQTLLDRFRDARRMMAKSYDAESVTNPSNGYVSATGLGRLKQRGRPLSGALEEIADAANNFRKSFQNPAAFGGVEPLSVLDLAFAAGNAAKAVAHGATGNVGGALAHALAAIPPFLRPFGRRAQLSPEYQQQMISGPKGISSAPLGGLTGAFLPTQPVPGNPGGNALMGLTTTQ